MTEARIRINVKFRGSTGERIVNAIVDTGAQECVVPPDLAREIGLRDDGQSVPSRIGFGAVQDVAVTTVFVAVPHLGNRELKVKALIADLSEPVLGLHAMAALGIRLNPADGSATVPNPLFEGGKTVLAGVGIASLVKLGYDFFTEEDVARPSRASTQSRPRSKTSQASKPAATCRGKLANGKPCRYKPAPGCGSYCRLHDPDR